MNLLRSPKQKLILAGVLLLSLAALAPTVVSKPGSGSSALARWALLGAAAAALLGWGLRARHPARAFALPSRLEVLARAGLAPRCGLALVEADGCSYLIVHGEGFAEIRPTRSPDPAGLAAGEGAVLLDRRTGRNPVLS